jgi:hypothetical protein
MSANESSLSFIDSVAPINKKPNIMSQLLHLTEIEKRIGQFCNISF